MRREASTPRPGWQQKLEQLGFDYYMLEGKAYWTEQACYAFTSDEIDTLEAATEDEEDMLDLAFGLTHTSRLGCQIIVTEELDGLTVSLPAATRNMMSDK